MFSSTSIGWWQKVNFIRIINERGLKSRRICHSDWTQTSAGECSCDAESSATAEEPAAEREGLDPQTQKSNLGHGEEKSGNQQINSLGRDENNQRNRDSKDIETEVSQLRERNHSFREIHKKDMDNILKAVYLVKLDEARQMKSLSQQNKSVIQQREQSLRARHRERRLDMAIQSEHAKQKYLEYWKHKLNSIYSSGQNDKR